MFPSVFGKLINCNALSHTFFILYQWLCFWYFSDSIIYKVGNIELALKWQKRAYNVCQTEAETVFAH